MNPFYKYSLVVWVIAAIDAVGGLLGSWSVTSGQTERLIVNSVELLVMLTLVATSYAIRVSVSRRTNEPVVKLAGWLCFFSILICVGGDIVNFNLPQTYYRYGGVVRHDYLADSVMFFAPGYLLLVIGVIRVVLWRGLEKKWLNAGFAASIVLGSLAYSSMVLPSTAGHVFVVTGLYSILITLVGISGLWLLQAYGWWKAPPGIWLVSLGLVLATVADGVIGQFWIFGNQGEGYYPAARYVNWVFYVGSQCLVIHLPRVVLHHGISSPSRMQAA